MTVLLSQSVQDAIKQIETAIAGRQSEQEVQRQIRMYENMVMSGIGIRQFDPFGIDEYPIEISSIYSLREGEIHWPRFDAPEKNWNMNGLEFEDHPEPIPQVKQPDLPLEVFHTQEFNASAAWEAVVALSRGC